MARGTIRKKMLRVRVEGCLDAVIAKRLIEAALRNIGAHNVDTDVPMPRGGKQGVLRDILSYARSGIRSVAFVDADEDAEEALDRLERMLAKYSNLTIAKNATPVPHALINRRIGRRDRPVALLVMWGRPPDYRRGTIEDLVCNMLHDTCEDTSRCLCEAAKRICSCTDTRAYKIATVALLATCGTGTLVYSQQLDRCGFDVIDAVARLRLHVSQPFKPYVELLVQHLPSLL